MKYEICRGLNIGQYWRINPSQRLVDIFAKISTTLNGVYILEYMPSGYPDRLDTEYTLTVAHPTIELLSTFDESMLSPTNLVVAKSFNPQCLSKHIPTHDLSLQTLSQLLADSSSQTSHDWAEILQKRKTIYYPNFL